MQEAKADAGKLEIALTPVQIVRDIAEVRMYGTKKYGDPDNWKRVELQRYINAMLRHTLAFWEDPYSADEESGIPHYKHAECNWAFISEMMKDASKEAERIKASHGCYDCKNRNADFCGDCITSVRSDGRRETPSHWTKKEKENDG